MIGTINNKYTTTTNNTITPSPSSTSSRNKKKRKLHVQLLSGIIEEEDINKHHNNHKNDSGTTTTSTTANNNNGYINDPYNEFAGPLTLQSCQCTHIQEYLPNALSSLSSSSLSSSTNDSNDDDNIIHQLHLLQYLNDKEEQYKQHDGELQGEDEEIESSKMKEMNMMFGEEELRRILSIQSCKSYHPLVSTIYQKNLLLKQLQQRQSSVGSTNIKMEDDKEIKKEDNNTTIVIKPAVKGRNAKQLPNLSKQYNKKNNTNNNTTLLGEKTLYYKQKEDLLLKYRDLLDNNARNKKNNNITFEFYQYHHDKLSKDLPSLLRNGKHNTTNTTNGMMMNISSQNKELLKKASSVNKWLEIYRTNRDRYWNRQQQQQQQQCMIADNNTNNNALLNCQWCNDCNDVTDDDQMMICLECAAIGCGPGSIYPNSKQCMMAHLLLSGHNFAVTCGNKANIYCFKCGDFIYHKVFTSEKLRIDISKHIPYMSWKEMGALQRSAKPGKFILHSELGNGGILWTGMEATYPNKYINSTNVIDAAKLSWKRYCVFHGNFIDSIEWGEKAMQLSLKLYKKKKQRDGSSNGINNVMTMTSANNKVHIQAPVGMYNLGNTCFMSCILQCLLHCPPLQNYFLSDIGHDYQACQLLRNSQDYTCFLPCTNNNNNNNQSTNKDNTTCLACEMDKIYLQMLGSSIGHDCIEALEEHKKPKSVLDTFDNLPSDPIIYCKEEYDSKHGSNCEDSKSSSNDVPSQVSNNNNTTSSSSSSSPSSATKSNKKRGKPFIPINFLTSAWKVEEMKHLKGYEQRDAHEFLHAFLDTCGRNMKSYRDVTSAMTGQQQKKQKQQQGQQQQQNNDNNFIQSLFGGTFCSVLFCEKCGCKRSQKEPYLIVSLPFRKDKTCSTDLPNNVTTSSPSDTAQSNNPNESSTTSTSNVASGITRSKSKDRKIDIQTCLENFTSAQSLADCVHCPSCNTFTSTLQQHTFSTFPKVLCLHLKRFDALTNKKITDPVLFPAYGLDMGPFLPHWRELVVQDDNNSNDANGNHNTSNSSSHNEQQNQKKLWNESSPKVLYDLFATVNHSGTLHQGHYVANVKVDEHWFHCNDAFISHSDSATGCSDDTTTAVAGGEKEVLESDSAYILFYIKRE